MTKKQNPRIQKQYSDFKITYLNTITGETVEDHYKDLNEFSEFLKTKDTPATIHASYTIKFIDLWQGRGDQSNPHPVVHSVKRELCFGVIENEEEVQHFILHYQLRVNKNLAQVYPETSNGIDPTIWMFFHRKEKNER